MPQPRTDFILTSDGDFPLEETYLNNIHIDTPIGLSDQQHIQDNIEYSEGELKFAPLIGFGVRFKINAEFSLYKVTKELKAKMMLDKYTILTGCLSPQAGGGYTIDTTYIQRKEAK